MKFQSLSLAILGISLGPVAWAYDSGSTGKDGAFNPTANTLIPLPADGVLHYTSVNIPAGVTVRFKRNTQNTPVRILASGDVTIEGVIDISGGAGRHSGGVGPYTDTTADGLPGIGGPGGFDGGRGGKASPLAVPHSVSASDQAKYQGMFGASGLGPGGGGGGKLVWNGNSHIGPTGGVGGSYTVLATLNDVDRNNTSWSRFRAPAGKAYGSTLLTVLLGGSGGGGGGGSRDMSGAGGGGGGGALLIAASGKLTLAGKIIANGGNGGGVGGGAIGSLAEPQSGATGGGGAGGAIRLVASEIAGAGELLALGGTTGTCLYDTCSVAFYTNTSVGGAGWIGGSAGTYGRIRLEAPVIGFSGKSTPPAMTEQEPQPAIAQGLPSLRIASVAGSQAPTAPSGSIDMIFPAELSNPVTVEFETVGVPPGNFVELMVTGPVGEPQVIKSGAIIGTTNAGTTSVQVNLPKGSSVLMASTTYVLTAVAGQALASLTGNERVEKLTVLAAQQGEAARYRLTTISGKQFEVAAELVAKLLA